MAGVCEKPKQKEGLPKKEGLGEFANLTGEGVVKKEGVVLLRGC